jgi:LysR family transcriptional regulator, positive regulator for ilvC
LIVDYETLRLFVHLSESLHFAKSGQACNISPSALSRQIQRLESEVGHRLFERDTRSVKLTAAGLIFRSYAKEVLAKWQDLKDSLAEDRGVLMGEIGIYCSVTASMSILPGLLSAFKAAHPQVHIRLQTGDAAAAIKKVVEGEADLAVAALPDRRPNNVEFKVLAQVSLDFISPKIPWEFASFLKSPIRWDKIPFILSQRGLARQRIDAWFERKKIRPNIYAQVAGNEAILAMVSLGCGVGIVPTLVIENSPIQNRINRLDIKPAPAPYPVGICVHKRKMKSRLVRAFWDLQSAANHAG